MSPGRARVALAVLMLAALGGCAPGLPQAGPADARAAQPTYPGTTEADLERGRSAYVHRCGSCHRLHRPSELAPGKWPAAVAAMTERAKLPPDEAADVTRYLVVLARPGEHVDRIGN